jgi:cytochrome c7-like protein
MATFGPKADFFLKLGLCAVGIAVAGGAALVWGVPRTDYYTGVAMVRQQPVPFSHEHHVGGLGLDCRYCHDLVETSATAGIPPTYTCMTCHSEIWTGAPMLAPVRRSLAEGKPLRWQRVYDLPGYVYFNHSIHVAKGVGCVTCHGRIDAMRLTYKASSLTMGWCLDCHRNPAPNLRPRDRVFDMAWQPPADDKDLGKRLMREYGVRTAGLTDCSTCHR